MDLKPVQCHATPNYPTRRDILFSAAGFLLIGLAGSGDEDGDDDFAKPPAGRTIVAPIFKHGEGRGATGCVVIAPPVFLSEEEAMQVIREELAKHGVKLGGPMTLDEVQVTARVETDYDLGDKDLKKLPKPRVQEDKDRIRPLTLNGIDREKKIAVRFVSEKAYRDLGGVGESFCRHTSSEWIAVSSSGQTYDFHETAEYVAAQLKKHGEADLWVGLLYDPAVSGGDFEKPEDKSYKQRRARAKAKAQDLLRQQSRDFVAWLKQQKAIRIDIRTS